jgi:hypothetical protein
MFIYLRGEASPGRDTGNQKTMKFCIHVFVLFAFLVFPPFLNAASPSGELVLVPGRYDDMARCLDELELEYVTMGLEELLSRKGVSEARAIFLPSGSLPSLEENIQVLTRPRNLGQVVIKMKDEVEEERLYPFLRDYVEEGGSVYLSGFAYRPMQSHDSPLLFEKSFPARGLAGPVELEFMERFPGFSPEKNRVFQVHYNGWIAPLRVRESRVLVRGSYSTVQGRGEGPLMVRVRRGRGAWYYSSLTCGAPGTRYVILQAAGRINRLKREERLHLEGYRVLRHFTDRVTSRSGYRSYPVNGAEDDRLLLTLEKGSLEWEIRDRDGRMVSAGRKGAGIHLLPSTGDGGTLYLYRLREKDPGPISAGLVQADPARIFWALAAILLLGFSAAGVIIYSRI